MSKSLDQIAKIIARGNVVVLTGAGISVESGIPDFRSPGGLWEKFNPMEYATIRAFRENPAKVWNMFRELGDILEAAQPNQAHQVLSDLEDMGLVEGVITQNIDGLHQMAGSREVIEFHGSGRRFKCLDCGKVYSRDQVQTMDFPPQCEGNYLKPDAVLFDEMIPNQALLRASELAQNCRSILVIGTSATVAPAGQIPLWAKQGGAHIIEINLEPTDLSSFSDFSCLGKATVQLEEILKRIHGS